MSLEEEVWAKLAEVIDPELGVDIVGLGLVYEVRAEDGEVEIEMTLTTAGCPLASVIEKKITKKVKEIEGVKLVTVELVWEPVWSIERASDEVRAELGFD
jgi:metal-sulfur cluster biosynthetic enzyme